MSARTLTRSRGAILIIEDEGLENLLVVIGALLRTIPIRTETQQEKGASDDERYQRQGEAPVEVHIHIPVTSPSNGDFDAVSILHFDVDDRSLTNIRIEGSDDHITDEDLKIHRHVIGPSINTDPITSHGIIHHAELTFVVRPIHEGRCGTDPDQHDEGRCEEDASDEFEDISARRGIRMSTASHGSRSFRFIINLPSLDQPCSDKTDLPTRCDARQCTELLLQGLPCMHVRSERYPEDAVRGIM